MKNIVIGIEGTVGAGKTSICRELLNDTENSIILHGGEIYRAIVYGMTQNKIQNTQNLDAFEIMKKLGIEIKLENKETVIYMKEKKIIFLFHLIWLVIKILLEYIKFLEKRMEDANVCISGNQLILQIDC